MSTDIESTIRQTQRYWYDDGLTEIAAGAILTAIGLLFAFEASLPAGSPLHSVSAFGLPVIVLIGGWLANAVVRRVKHHVTYPRTGYVSYHRASPRRRAVAGLLGAGIAAAVAVWIIRFGGVGRQWIPAVDGLVIGAMLLFIGYQLGLTRFFALAAASVAIGLFASWRAPDEIVGSAWFFGTLGVILVLVGTAVLARYLRHTQPAGDASAGPESAPDQEVAQ